MNLCFFTLNFFVKNKNVLTPSITVKVVHSRLQLIFLYLTECQIQTAEKKKNAKVLPVSIFPAAMYFVLEIFALTFCTFLS